MKNLFKTFLLKTQRGAGLLVVILALPHEGLVHGDKLPGHLPVVLIDRQPALTREVVPGINLQMLFKPTIPAVEHIPKVVCQHCFRESSVRLHQPIYPQIILNIFRLSKPCLKLISLKTFICKSYICFLIYF